jgi:cytochrome c biogenesis protein CcmG/thiol:disulfide interchange protein DsbE
MALRARRFLGQGLPRLWLRPFLAAAFLLALSGCVRASAAPERTAPDFTIAVYRGAEVLGGSEVRFSSVLRQGKPVVLNFWAGLCPPCRAEMPDLQRVAEEFQGRVLVLGLDVGPFVGLGSREDGQALLAQLGITYPTGTTFEPAVVREYQLAGMPTTVFITPKGVITRQWTGIMTREQMIARIEELLAASS